MVDISIEYNSCYEEFIGPNVWDISKDSMWITYHTEHGYDYLSCYPITLGEQHERVLIPNELAMEIFKDKNPYNGKNVNKCFGGHYWINKEHTEHLGK